MAFHTFIKFYSRTIGQIEGIVEKTCPSWPRSCAVELKTELCHCKTNNHAVTNPFSPKLGF